MKLEFEPILSASSSWSTTKIPPVTEFFIFHPRTVFMPADMKKWSHSTCSGRSTRSNHRHQVESWRSSSLFSPNPKHIAAVSPLTLFLSGPKLLSFSDICEAEADTLLSSCGVKAAKISAGGTVGCSTSTQVGSGDTLLQTKIDVENPSFVDHFPREITCFFSTSMLVYPSFTLGYFVCTDIRQPK